MYDRSDCSVENQNKWIIMNEWMIDYLLSFKTFWILIDFPEINEECTTIVIVMSPVPWALSNILRYFQLFAEFHLPKTNENKWKQIGWVNEDKTKTMIFGIEYRNIFNHVIYLWCLYCKHIVVHINSIRMAFEVWCKYFIGHSINFILENCKNSWEKKNSPEPDN